MKLSLIIPVLAGGLSICLTTIGKAQSDGYYLIYGNRDGSTINVRLGQIIAIPAWGATDPANLYDAINYLHMPLATNDSIVVERLGGEFPDTLIGLWDEIQFLPTNQMVFPPGFTNQSLQGYAYLFEPPDWQNFFITYGDTILMCYYLMRLTDNPLYADSTVCPFITGEHPQQGGPIWGAGIPEWEPLTTFSFLRFVVCDTDPGDANADWLFNGLDVIYCVNYLKGAGPEPPCKRDCPPYGNVFFRADSNGNCVFNGLDITYSINYLKGTGPLPPECQSCP